MATQLNANYFEWEHTVVLIPQGSAHWAGRSGISGPPPRQIGCGWNRSRTVQIRGCRATGHCDGADLFLLTPEAAPGPIRD